MTVQLAAVPCVGSTTPNVIVFSNGKTVEIELKKYKAWSSYESTMSLDTIADKCFVGIWQNSADMDEVWQAVEYIKSRPGTDVWVSCYSYIKRRSTRLRNLGVDLKPLADNRAARRMQNEKEQKEKNLNDLKELAASLS
jgi:hypothetical protein|tara:strand:- start:45 stop:461 length:417 start_codon:yes stop_codon:yes gene_type:complete